MTGRQRDYFEPLCLLVCAAEAAQRDCNEAEYGRREALCSANSALRDTNAARNSQPLMRILLEPQWHLGVCVCVRTRVTIAR